MGDALGRKHIKVSKVFSPASPENTDMTKSIPKVVSSYHFTSQQQNRELGFFIWQLAQDTVHVQNNFSPQRMWFPLFPPHPGSYQVVFRAKLMGCRQWQPSWAKGMLNLLLQWTPFLFNNGTSKKKTGKNNNHIPSKNSSKSFLANCMSRKSSVWAYFIKTIPLPMSIMGHYPFNGISGS